MDIALRKQKILSAVIESFIATGEPVGSKTLQQRDDFNVSSATIRNELADLTLLGFLTQPHTSAGRIPTRLGYKYYVEKLMKVTPLSENVKGYIDHCLKMQGDAPEHILQTATKLISELTQCVAIASTPSGQNARIHNIKFLQTGRYTSMVVLITSQGMVKSRLFRCDFEITPEMLKIFDKALNENLAGQPLSTVTKPFIQTFAMSFGELSLLMADMLLAVAQLCKDADGINIYTHGATKLLYSSQMDLLKGARLLEFLSDNKNLEEFVAKIPEGTNIYISDDILPLPLRQNSFTITQYYIENKIAGSIGVISPLRADYSKLVSTVEYVASAVGQRISEII